MSEKDSRSRRAKARRNMPDLGGPTWHESMQQRDQEFREGLKLTLKSAIERNVIPDIWNVSEDERGLFFRGLQGAISERIRYIGVRDEPQREHDREYSDKELQGAWSYVQQRHEYETRLLQTLSSAIQRGVIPDIQNLPDHEGVKGDIERLYFLNLLENPSPQWGGARPLDTTFSDDDLRRAWNRTQNDIEELRLAVARKAEQDAVNVGLLPSADSTDPDLYRRYYLRATQIPQPVSVPERVKVWDDVKSEWETTKKAGGIDVEPATSKSNADDPKPREQRGMKAGTANRVREMHRLLKQGVSQRQAKQQARCDPSTYYLWCLEATGEEPIEPYR